MNTVLQATKRESGHRSTLTQLREAGLVPGVIYGYKIENTPISVSEKEYNKIIGLQGSNGVFQIELDGKKVNAVLGEAQREALRDKYLHLDFVAIDMTEELEVEVPIVLVGEPVGVHRDGGVLVQPNREVVIKVQPSEIPETLEVDVAGLEIGDVIDVKDIRKQVKFEIVEEDEYTLANVVPPRLANEDEESEDAEATATEE